MRINHSILERIEELDIKFVHFRYSDIKGRLHQTTFSARAVDKTLLEAGIPFDGSSLVGYKSIHESDMLLRPEHLSPFFDPFSQEPALIVYCNVVEPSTGDLYSHDPRSIAHRAEKYMQTTGLADTAYMGPEIEFFLFDDVQYKVSGEHTFFKIKADESPTSSSCDLAHGNLGHRPQEKKAYCAVSPLDSATEIRSEMVEALEIAGVEAEMHHHEVSPCQHEIGMRFSSLVDAADKAQLYKYVVQNVAHLHNRTATFMPKPIFGDNGSGMHVHQSLWLKGKPLFAGDAYEGLSELALYYIGGLLKHARALNAFTNPSTNSYKRLVPGYEAPVYLAYSYRNRSAACRVPYTQAIDKARRIEARFPDPSANPYLAFSAMLMAGLDGIKNKIHPGKAAEEDLYHLTKEQKLAYPSLCGSLREALDALEKDHAFLLEGGVYTKDFINKYIEIKTEEIDLLNMTPHPMEYKLYYSI